MSKSKVLFNMSGSIAAFKACEVLSQLVKDGHEVRVVCTPSTFEFIGRSTLEGLSGHKVLSDMYESGQAMDHIHLARWADFAILCPASASTLARLAHGFADDLVSALFLAWGDEKPYFVVPAMNTQMYQSLITQENIRKISSRGVRVLPTAEGSLACGEVGAGRMLEPRDILTALSSSKGNLLVTYGGTREPIDDVRFITNLSGGGTGAEIARRLSSLGWNVTTLRAESARSTGSADLTFTDFGSLDTQMKQLLDQREFAGVVHLAAVSDFSVAEPHAGKLSSREVVSIQLKPNHKIVSRLKSYAGQRPLNVVAFKLTSTADLASRKQAVDRLLAEPVDYVVHNDVKDLRREDRPFEIFDTNRGSHRCSGVAELALHLDQILSRRNS